MWSARAELVNIRVRDDVAEHSGDDKVIDVGLRDAEVAGRLVAGDDEGIVLQKPFFVLLSKIGWGGVDVASDQKWDSPLVGFG